MLLDTVGKRIKYLREKAKLTQEEVAEKLGISQSAYNRYEKDQIHRFSKSTISKLALILDSTPEFILGITEDDARLRHLPDYLQKFVLNPESVEYIARAYLEYTKDKIQKDLNKQ